HRPLPPSILSRSRLGAGRGKAMSQNHGRGGSNDAVDAKHRASRPAPTDSREVYSRRRFDLSLRRAHHATAPMISASTSAPPNINAKASIQKRMGNRRMSVSDVRKIQLSPSKNIAWNCVNSQSNEVATATSPSTISATVRALPASSDDHSTRRLGGLSVSSTTHTPKSNSSP